MTNFSTNQVMQFYVCDAGVAVKPYANEKACKLIIGAGETAVATDKIENVMWAKVVEPAMLKTPYVEATLTFNAEVNGGTPVADQDYIVRVSYPAVGGVGVEAWTVKSAAARGTDATAVMTELAEGLNKAFEADGVLVATVGESAGSLVITQTDIAVNTYERGIRPALPVFFRVEASPIMLEGELVDWLDEDSYKVTPSTAKFIGGAFKLADMEYFAMGERGDEYRMAGYPNYIKTDYKVDTTKEYYVVNIHYAYVGANDQSHKSEKDLIIATTVDPTSSWVAAIAAATGCTFEAVKKAE